MKKISIYALCLSMAVCMVGCGEATTQPPKTEIGIQDSVAIEEGTTLGNKLADAFKKEISNTEDISVVAEKLETSGICEFNCAVESFEEGFMPGFNEDIKGFKKAVGFMPYIGSIPFVGYIFEVDDAESFKEDLIAKANPAWNICTEATETVVETSGNYVFFAMCP